MTSLAGDAVKHCNLAQYAYLYLRVLQQQCLYKCHLWTEALSCPACLYSSYLHISVWQRPEAEEEQEMASLKSQTACCCRWEDVVYNLDDKPEGELC